MKSPVRACRHWNLLEGPIWPNPILERFLLKQSTLRFFHHFPLIDTTPSQGFLGFYIGVRLNVKELESPGDKVASV